MAAVPSLALPPAPRRPLPRRLPRLLVALLLAGAAPRADADPPATVTLEGARAEVLVPPGAWEETRQTLAPGQWRVVFRAAGTECEARVFPVQEIEDPVVVLQQAADRVSRQVRADGFGLPARRAFVLDGRAAAESTWWATLGTRLHEGRIRLLRAEGRAWALAWALAPVDAPRALREAADAFARGLRPTEPAFYEPAEPRSDPEEVVATDARGPVVRRQLLAALEALEAGAGVVLPTARRAELLEGLAREAREGGDASREGFRALASELAEARGRPEPEQAALRATLGRRLVETLFRRADAGHRPAEALAVVVAMGRRPLAGDGADALPRFAAEALLELFAFVASFAADAAVTPSGALEESLLASLRARWPALPAAERDAWRARAARAAGLAERFRAADPVERLRLRTGVVGLLLPETAEPPPPAPPPVPDPARALRARLDRSPRDPAALLEAVASLSAADLERLLAPLAGPAPALR